MADEVKAPEKPEEVVSNQIIDELARVHMRTPKF